MICIKVGNIGLIIGGYQIMSALFYSIAHDLENREWGSKYPVIMNELYYGDMIECDNLQQALAEIKEIKEEFKKLSPREMIMNYDDIIKVAPWEFEFIQEAQSLYDAMRSPDNCNIIDTIILALELGIKQNASVYLEGGILIHKMETIKL